MKNVFAAGVALLALSSLAVTAQEGKRGDQGGGQRQAPAAAQPSPGGGGMRGGGEMRGGGAMRGGGEIRGGGMMQQRQARPDAGMQRGPRMGGDTPRMQRQPGMQRQMMRGDRSGMAQRQMQRGDRNWNRGDRNWRRDNWRNRNNWRGPAAASAFVFLGGPRIIVRPGWCRGLHRGYHRAPGLGWHRGTHRGLYRC